MTAAGFDPSAYRRTVLTPLRSANPASVQDVFWLGSVPRDWDDATAISGRLREAKAFLHKERSRPRQADVAAAVLKEWSRVEGVLADDAARSALRARLEGHAPGAEVGSGAATPAPAAAAGAGAPRLRQVRAALDELARIREEPELAEDLFAFLGLPVTATADMVRARVERVGDANRKRRADRERSLVDELLMHSRELLVDGDAAAYRAALAGDPAALDAAPTPQAEAAAPTPVVDIPETFVAEDGTVMPVSPPPWNGPPPGPAPSPGTPPKIDYTRRRKPAPAPQPAEARPTPVAAEPPPAATEPTPATADAPPAVTALGAIREPSGSVLLTWEWPFGVTEVFVAVGEGATPDLAVPPGRKVTNSKYDLDGGARFDGVATGTPLRVFSGRRDQAGRLSWSPATLAPATIAP